MEVSTVYSSAVKANKRSKRVLFDRTVPCLGRIFTMHHRISKKLGTNFHHNEALCRAQDPGMYLKFQTIPCPAHISTMHHRITKLLGTHVHHDGVKCQALDPGPYLNDQSHT